MKSYIDILEVSPLDDRKNLDKKMEERPEDYIFILFLGLTF
jgi:hypothetical protein